MSKELTENELLKEISGKITLLAGAVAIQGRDVDTQIKILTRLGLSSKQIGQLLGFRAESVRRRRTSKKKSRSSGKA